MKEAKASGLEGVVAAQTALSHVDGERGELIIAGAQVEKLAGSQRFEQVCATLWRVPEVDLGPARVWAAGRLSSLGQALEHANGMDALRAAVAQLPSDIDALKVTGAVAVFGAAWARRRQGLQAIAPDARLTHAADTLRMVTGAAAEQPLVDALDTYLVAVIDHGMNASTFTARVIASTQSDLVSSVTGAIGALKGPLHGGAPGPVLDMLDAVEVPEQATAWLEKEIAAGRRIMGMGHRIYRVRDPRASVLETAVERLERAGVTSRRLALARAVERAATQVLAKRYPDRGLQANVEFYTAVLLDTVGLPRELFSPLFAMGRMAGWCAHVAEQRATGRLIRPDSEYVGPMPASSDPLPPSQGEGH
ncbi:MAG: citrate synthase [Archangium sp.]|nr:citrate synthase [Archangium sp.]MDP3570818.1 citrate synthase [Archangium sp.]